MSTPPFEIVQINDDLGHRGYSGVSGISGLSGYPLAVVPQPDGTGVLRIQLEGSVSGYSGFSGYSGASGASGMGYSGFSGYSGASGFSGASGLSGYSGTATDHASLTNLGYSESNHSGFQKELIWDGDYKAYLIEH